MLEAKLRSLRGKNLEVCLLCTAEKSDKIIARVTYYDQNNDQTIWVERLIRFEDLRIPPTTVSTDSVFEFNMSNILDNMAAEVLGKVEYYGNKKSDIIAIY